MKPTKTLPADHHHHLDIRPGDYRKGHLLVLLISLPMAIGFYFAFTALARINRPALVQNPGWNPKFNVSVLLSVALVFGVIAIIHECIHGALIWIHTREIPKLRIQFPGVGIAAPDWYFPRSQMLLIELAPLFIITMIGALSLPFIPPEYVGIAAIGLTINAVGSYMDVVVFLYTYLLPVSSYIRLANSFASVYIIKLDESTWKSRLLDLLEQELMPKFLS
jgi:hypothetical protein